MSTYLSCNVGKGQFGGEWAIRGRAHGGGEFSLFAPSEFVQADASPAVDGFTHGWLRVELLDADDRRVLVRLPRQAFENGHTVTGGREQIRSPAESAAV